MISVCVLVLECAGEGTRVCLVHISDCSGMMDLEISFVISVLTT